MNKVQNTGQFSKVIVTKVGKEMIAKSQNGQTLTFTRVAFGDGLIEHDEDPVNFTALKSERLSANIAKYTDKGNGQFELQFRVSNQEVETGFWHREIGVMAKIDEGPEQLYAYTTAGNQASFLYDKTTPVEERIVNIAFVIGNAQNVQVVVNSSIIYATIDDMKEAIATHNTSTDSHAEAFNKHNADLNAHSDLFNKKLDKTGGTLTGDLNASGHNITATKFIGNVQGNLQGTATNADQTKKIVNTVEAGQDTDLIYTTMGGNDQFRLRVGGANNEGYAELATSDDGNEPIYVRQYTSGTFRDVRNSATLLDRDGNTSFPKTVTAQNFNGLAKKAEQDKNGRDIVNTYAPLTNPNLIGVPTAPTAGVDTNTTQVATTAFVRSAINKYAPVETTLQRVYPVGSIYMSTVATNPAELFGFGTWEAMPAGRVLLAQGKSDWGTTYNAGETGGEATHQLTVGELPEHRHSGSISSAGEHKHAIQCKGESGASNGVSSWYARNWQRTEYTDSTGNHSHTVTINNAGNNEGHNNIQPYIAICIWKRIS